MRFAGMYDERFTEIVRNLDLPFERPRLLFFGGFIPIKVVPCFAYRNAFIAFCQFYKSFFGVFIESFRFVRVNARRKINATVLFGLLRRFYGRRDIETAVYHEFSAVCEKTFYDFVFDSVVFIIAKVRVYVD